MREFQIYLQVCVTFSSSDKTVKIWDAGTRQCVHTFYDHTDQVSTIPIRAVSFFVMSKIY